MHLCYQQFLRPAGKMSSLTMPMSGQSCNHPAPIYVIVQKLMKLKEYGPIVGISVALLLNGSTVRCVRVTLTRSLVTTLAFRRFLTLNREEYP